MSGRVNALHLVLKVVVYISLYFATAYVLGPLLYWLGGYIVGITATGLLAAAFSNSLCLRIYARRGIAAIGLQGDKAALVNLGFGCLGGVGAAALVLAGPLLFHAARIQADPASPASLSSFFFVSVLLLFGSAGEELLFRGFGFQVLLRALGAWTTILPVGVVFAALHAANPNATWLGLANTAGFGILFGYAFLRSHDIWLPIGLHFGWNFTLPLFGVNVSGLTMRLTGFTMRWSAGTLWSGGEYGPEASVLTSAVLLLLFAYLWKAPIRRQASALLDPPAGDVTCVPGQPFSPSSRS
ncbi:MAG TPA: type II CAAX endopeptidase family protein [Bryobacteraceae bacterium]|nr:type II CAAX endopeptidase family protein [Bryobacteraceae bacterium]